MGYETRVASLWHEGLGLIRVEEMYFYEGAFMVADNKKKRDERAIFVGMCVLYLFRSHCQLCIFLFFLYTTN